MIFTFIDDERGNHHVSILCRTMKVTRAGYYAWRNRSISAHEQRDCELARQILEIHEQSRGTYGSPRVFAMLKRRGVSVSRKRVERLMREYGIKGVSRSRRRVGKRVIVEREEQACDLVKRDFRADAPNQLWFADITYVKTYEGWLYLAVVFDIWSRMVVGWSMAANMAAELVDDALRMGVTRRSPMPGLVHHSDYAEENTKPQVAQSA